MPRAAIGLGTVLIGVGVIACSATAFASWTALIPAILGTVILVCGLIGPKEKNQRLRIHVALVVAILGTFGTGVNVMQVGALIAGEAVGAIRAGAAPSH